MLQRLLRARVLVALSAVGLTVGLAVPTAQAVPPGETIPITGTFSFTTSNGVLPTWEASDLVLIGVSPGSVVTTATGITARVQLPLVAKTGTAYAAAGGFRIANTETGASVRCSTPTIDTAARVVDCVLPGGRNEQLLTIDRIDSRSRVWGSTTVTMIFRGVDLRLTDQDAADLLNEALDVNVFSPSVLIGTGDLIAARPRQ